MIDLRSIVKNGRGDFALIGTQGPVCMFYDEPRRTVGDLTPSDPNLTRYCPPGNGLEQRGAVNAPRPDDLGTSSWTSPGGVSGPPAVTDPLLIPNGANSCNGGANSSKGHNMATDITASEKTAQQDSAQPDSAQPDSGTGTQPTAKVAVSVPKNSPLGKKRTKPRRSHRRPSRRTSHLPPNSRTPKPVTRNRTR